MTAVEAPPIPSVLSVKSFDELKKAMLIQKIISRKAHDQLQAIVAKFPPPNEDDSQEVHYFSHIIQEESGLIKEYAEQPTLSEFAADSELLYSFMWGATFAVTLLMGELILHHIHSPSTKLSSINKFLLTRLLQEVAADASNEQAMMARVMKTARISFPNVKDDKERDRMIRELLQPVLESMALMLVEYGLMESNHGHYSLTAIGKRVLLHLVDAQRYVDEVLKAHAKFQEANPQRASARVD